MSKVRKFVAFAAMAVIGAGSAVLSSGAPGAGAAPGYTLCSTGTVAESPAGAMASVGNTVYAAIPSSDELVAIDATTRAVTDRVTVGDFPDGVAVVAGKAYVANATSGDVSVVDLATFTVVATVPGLDNPIGPAAAGGKVYVSSAGAIHVIDPATDTVVTTIAGASGYPYELLGYVYVLEYSHVAIIETTGDTILGGFDTGGELAVGIAEHDGFTYVANAISNNVSVVPAGQLIVSQLVPVGGNPRDVEVFNGEVLVSSSDTGEIQVIYPGTWVTATYVDLGGEDTVDRMITVGDQLFVSGYPSSTFFEGCLTPDDTPTTQPPAPVAVEPAFTG